MRWTQLTLLSLALCVLVAGCAARARENHKAAKEAKGEPVAVAVRKTGALTWPVKGWGKNQEAAKERALKNARDCVITQWQSSEPPPVWIPSLNDVRKSVKLDNLQRRQELDEQVEGENMECWSWTATLPSPQLENFRREDVKRRAEIAVQERSAIAEERMLGLSKLVGVMVLALGGVWLLTRLVRMPRENVSHG